MNKPKQDEGYHIAVHCVACDQVMPAEIRLIENQLGELVQQMIREADQED